SKVLGQRFCFRIRQHATDLLQQYVFVMQLPLLGNGQQFGVWNAAPQEEGEARSQLKIADRVDLASCYVVRFFLEAEEEAWVDQNAGKRLLDAYLKTTFATALFEEGEYWFDVLNGNRLAECLGRDVHRDALGALPFFIIALRIAAEDTLAASRSAGASSVERAYDFHGVDSTWLGINRIDVINAGGASRIEQRDGASVL